MKTRLGLSVSTLMVLFLAAVVSLATLSQDRPENQGSVSATYKEGTLRVSIPFDAPHTGAGYLIVEVLDPEDRIAGRIDRHVFANGGQASWKEDLQLPKTLAIDDLLW